MSLPPSPLADQVKADPILFRPTKKRKIYRQRATEDEIANENAETAPPALSPPAPTPTPAQSLDELISAASATASGKGRDEVEEEGASALSVAEILRLRKKNKARGGGVEFRALGHVARDEEAELMVRGDDEEKVNGGGVGKGVIRVFAPQTGTVGDVNRHMMAYIDSELAKRRAVEGAPAQPLESALSSRSGAPMGDVGGGGGTREKGKLPETQRQPASIGKLQEIDLGDEVRDRNIERTTNAQRRLNGEIVEEEEANEGGKKKKKKKVRLNRDGSVWVPRKRRGSDDIKRDQLVEAVLRENKLEIYEEPAQEPEDLNDDQAADDRIAEAFRKDFLDAVSQKRRRRPAAAQAAPRGPGGKKEEESRGPKLGGSRSARAAMREAMLAKAKK